MTNIEPVSIIQGASDLIKSLEQTLEAEHPEQAATLKIASELLAKAALDLEAFARGDT